LPIGQLLLELARKPLSNGLLADEMTISVVNIAFSKYLIDGAQVQVDSVIQVELDDLQVDSVMERKRHRPIFLPCQQNNEPYFHRFFSDLFYLTWEALLQTE